MTPMACDLAIDRGVVRSDGTLSANFFDLFNEAGNRFGKARIQKMMFTELAVYPYRLAPSAREVTRWDRKSFFDSACGLSRREFFHMITSPATFVPDGNGKEAA